MTFVEVGASAREALRLLARHPGRWLPLMAVFLAIAESLALIPYVGYLAKVGAASLMSAGLMANFAAVARGEPPRFARLGMALNYPFGSQALLVLSAWLPFLVGVGVLGVLGGASAAGFFFGNVFVRQPPSDQHFFAFKLVLYLSMLPAIFVAPTLALTKRSGMDALRTALWAARQAWLALAVVFAVGVAWEWTVGALTAVAPGSAGLLLILPLLLGYVAWSFGFMYALAVRALPAVEARSP